MHPALTGRRPQKTPYLAKAKNKTYRLVPGSSRPEGVRSVSQAFRSRFADFVRQLPTRLGGTGDEDPLVGVADGLSSASGT